MAGCLNKLPAIMKFYLNLLNGLNKLVKSKNWNKKQRIKLKEFTTKTRRKELVKVRK
jgi:hypothetical protein